MDSADNLKSKGVDEIVCVAVNDPFVMAAWAQDQNAEGKVTAFIILDSVWSESCIGFTVIICMCVCVFIFLRMFVTTITDYL